MGNCAKKSEKSNKVADFITAGHEDAMIIRDNEFLKQAKINEIKFYVGLNDKADEFYEENQKLKQFIPKFFGIDIINGKQYLRMENLLKGCEKGSILDIKLGKSTVAPGASEKKIKKQEEAT